MAAAASRASWCVRRPRIYWQQLFFAATMHELPVAFAVSEGSAFWWWYTRLLPRGMALKSHFATRKYFRDDAAYAAFNSSLGIFRFHYALLAAARCWSFRFCSSASLAWLQFICAHAMHVITSLHASILFHLFSRRYAIIDDDSIMSFIDLKWQFSLYVWAHTQQLTFRQATTTSSFAKFLVSPLVRCTGRRFSRSFGTSHTTH